MRISDWSSDVCSSDLRLQPFAHHRFRFAALVARHPGRIDVGGVDHAAAMLDEAVEDREARGAVRRPSKDVAAKNEGTDGKAAVAQRAFGHGVSPCFTAGTASRGLSLNQIGRANV